MPPTWEAWTAIAKFVKSVISVNVFQLHTTLCSLACAADVYRRVCHMWMTFRHVYQTVQWRQNELSRFCGPLPRLSKESNSKFLIGNRFQITVVSLNLKIMHDECFKVFSHATIYNLRWIESNPLLHICIIQHSPGVHSQWKYQTFFAFTLRKAFTINDNNA